MNKDKSGVYGIKLKDSSKCYIGSSVRIYARWYEHRRQLNRGKHCATYLQNAWKKYGTDAFQFFIIEECDPKLLIQREQHYIDALHPVFNTCRIAGSRLGTKQSPEAIEKVRQAHLGRKCTPETIEKMRAAALGNQRNLGKKLSAETKAKIAVAHEGKPKPALQGRPLHPDTVAKISAAQKGKPREWQRGTNRSPETREKMRLKALEREAERRQQVAATGIKPVHWTTLYPERRTRGERIGTAKLTYEQVDLIRSRYAAGGTSLNKLAAEFNVSKKSILLIVHRQTWING